jgi:hypothetical protein
VLYAAIVDFFGPLRREQERVALQANIAAVRHQARARRSLGVRCHHLSFPIIFFLRHPLPVASLDALCGIGVAWSTATMLSLWIRGSNDKMAAAKPFYDSCLIMPDYA